jgi:hypothetical protein
MTWLFVPGTSSPSAPASAGSSLESPSPSTPGERLHAASATWRGKHQPPQAWSRRWKQGGFIRLLSGPTLPPSMLDHGVASFISSLREIPARTTASPASAPAPMESASLPRRSCRIADECRPRLIVRENVPGNADGTARGHRPGIGAIGLPRCGRNIQLGRDRKYHAARATVHHGREWAMAMWPSARAEDSESAGKRVARGVSDTLTAAARDWPQRRGEQLAGTSEPRLSGQQRGQRHAAGRQVKGRTCWITQPSSSSARRHPRTNR